MQHRTAATAAVSSSPSFRGTRRLLLLRPSSLSSSSSASAPRRFFFASSSSPPQLDSPRLLRRGERSRTTTLCSTARGATTFAPSRFVRDDAWSSFAASAASSFQRRSLSDNLLGHSPMASRPPPASSARPPSKPPGGVGVVGVDSNTAGGGVWAQTSAKRDKLGELRLELPEGVTNLDDAATETQKLDLRLADGLGLLGRCADEAWGSQSLTGFAVAAASSGGTRRRTTTAAGGRAKGNANDASAAALGKLEEFMAGTEPRGRGGGGGEGSDEPSLTREQFDAHLAEATRILSSSSESGSSSFSPLRCARDFVECEEVSTPDDENSTETTAVDPTASTFAKTKLLRFPTSESDKRSLADPTSEVFDACSARYRVLLTTTAADKLSGSWDELTRLTDGDVDRAAVRGVHAEPYASTLPLRKVNAVLRSCAAGTCADRVSAFWDLMDRDDDGLIDQIEMDEVAWLAVNVVEDSLKELFREAVESRPVRKALPTLEEEEEEERLLRGGGTGIGSDHRPEAKPGWRERRAEAKAKKRLIKLFDKSAKRHFDVEVEMPHRLRCVYAWADKSHQDNKIDSVLVDADSPGGGSLGAAIAGRKRYVELHPKISHKEFVEVQKEHFGHLDRIAEEIMSSFREDLLVDQGKGRQNKQLRRDCALFLIVVGLIDVGIVWM